MTKIKTRGPSQLQPYFPVADAIVALFRPHVEVVIHDLATTTITYISNPISRRKVGDSSLGEQPFEMDFGEEVIGPYRKVNRDGRNLRSITAVLRDDAGKPIAQFCINFDVSLLESIGAQLAGLAFLPGSLAPHAPFYHDNWRQRLERTMEAFEAENGMSINAMNTQQRIALISALENEGMLSVRNAPSVVAERIGFSRAALYKHLKAIRAAAPGGTKAGQIDDQDAPG